MSNFAPNKEFLVVILLHYFNIKKTVSESREILVRVYGDHVPSERTCLHWFALFKSGNFKLEDKEQLRTLMKKFENEDEELESKIYEDSSKTQEVDVNTYEYEVGRQKIHYPSKFFSEKIWKPENWVPVPVPTPKKEFLRRVLLNYFNMNKSVYDSFWTLEDVYGEEALTERTCQRWFKRFKSGKFNLEDKDYIRKPKKFEDEELEVMVNEDSSKTQQELANILRVTQPAISYRLKTMRMFRKAGKLASLSKI